MSYQTPEFSQNAYLKQETGEVKRQARLAFKRCLDSLSPLTPHRDEPSTVLTKDREMPSLCTVTGLQGPASMPWKQVSCPGGTEQQQASCTVNPHPPNPADQTHFIIKVHILKQNNTKSCTKRPWVWALQATVGPHGSGTGLDLHLGKVRTWDESLLSSIPTQGVPLTGRLLGCHQESCRLFPRNYWFPPD